MALQDYHRAVTDLINEADVNAAALQVPAAALGDAVRVFGKTGKATARKMRMAMPVELALVLLLGALLGAYLW